MSVNGDVLIPVGALAQAFEKLKRRIIIKTVAIAEHSACFEWRT